MLRAPARSRLLLTWSRMDRIGLAQVGRLDDSSIDREGTSRMREELKQYSRWRRIGIVGVV